VDATTNADGRLSVCSGNSSAEWYLILDPTATLMSIEALRKRLDLTVPHTPNVDDEVLDLLVRAFSRASRADPYREIKCFLDESGIPWRSDFWESL
jgi:hypothetical protein